jgi:hypothetical protein
VDQFNEMPCCLIQNQMIPLVAGQRYSSTNRAKRSLNSSVTKINFESDKGSGNKIE